MSREIGQRVGAVLSASGARVELLGFGVYAGEEVPPQPPPMTGCATWEELDAWYEREAPASAEEMKRAGSWPLRLANPKIVLDCGDVVWGQECWWGGEEAVRARVAAWEAAGAEVVRVSIAEAREAAR